MELKYFINMNKESLRIVLNQYKQEYITEEEAVTLIEDLTTSTVVNNPIYPYWPQITYETEPKIQKWEVTCKQ